jgi:hypothetical protein
MTPEERSFEAKAILENRVFKEALVDIREAFVRQLEACGMGDVQTQHEITLSLQILKRIQTQLARYIQEGKLAEEKRKQDTFMNRIRERLA